MEKYLEVLCKFNFGEDWFPLYRVFYDYETTTLESAKKQCIEYIRQYRANHKRAEFKIKDETGKLID